MDLATVLIVLGVSGLLVVLGVLWWDLQCERKRIARLRRLLSDDEDRMSFRTDDKGRFR